MNVFSAAAHAIREGRAACLVTVIDVGGSTPRSAGARMLVHADRSLIGTIGGGALEQQAIDWACESIARGRPARHAVHLVHDLGMCCGGRVEVFCDPIHRRAPFIIFGAGHVAHALAPVLVALDFDVTVVDAREDWCTPDRFPGCHTCVASPDRYAAALPEDHERYFLVVTHDHALDQALAEILVPTDFTWCGMIGSRAKVARFMVRLRAAGVAPEHLQRLCAPVGLDIGAETPAEIAVAIAAEVVRVRRRSQRPAIPLSEHALEARGGDGKARAPGLSD